MKRLCGLLVLVVAGILPPSAQAQPADRSGGRQNPLAFQISEFKSVIEKYSLLGRGVIRLSGDEYRNSIIGVRVRYVLRLKNEPFSYNSTAWVVLNNGVGFVEVNAFLPEVVLNTLRAEKDYPVFDWSVDGWFFMNPAKISGN